MIRHLFTCLLSVVALSATVVAGDHYYFPDPIFAAPQMVYAAPQYAAPQMVYAAPLYAAPQPQYAAPQMVYAAPVVSYQPAYRVPTATVAVQAYPFGPVIYSPQYFAPLVPTVSSYAVVPATVSGYYAPQGVYVAPAAYGVSVYAQRGFHHYRHGGVRVEFERDGDIEISYR